ncbi:MAG: restriction endonuclease subunit S [Bacteroidia bacterium]|nr:restriction endonuclease subunit S [Bacteroidia bacterium]
MKENWKYKKLGEIATFTSGSRPAGGVGNINEGVLSLGGEHIGRNGHIDLSSPKYVTYDYYNENKKGHIVENDILLCKDGALTGKVAILRGELSSTCSMVNEHVFILRAKSILQWYLFYFLYSHIGQLQLKIRIKGAAQGGLNGTNLKTISIPVPPLPVQQQIVAELDLLSDIIEKQKQQIAELDKLAQATFYDMFGDPVTNEKGWEKSELGKICDVRDGTHDSPEYYEHGFPLVTSKNIIDGCISFDNVNYICEEDYLKISKRSHVDNGDIIMPMIGTIGKPVIVKKSRDFAIKNVALIKFIKDSKANNIFIQAIMSSRAFDDYMKGKNKGGTQKFIALGDIRKLDIPVPPLQLQQSFASKIEAIERQKELISNSIRESRRLFDSRMEYWFG